MLDLRFPSGSFFVLLGAIVLGYGIIVPDARAALTETNVDLYCGLAMLAFGAFLLALAFRAARRGA
jgi:hypothetical protein